MRHRFDSYRLARCSPFWVSGQQSLSTVTTASDSIFEYERWCITKDNANLDSIANYNKDVGHDKDLTHDSIEFRIGRHGSIKPGRNLPPTTRFGYLCVPKTRFCNSSDAVRRRAHAM
jgi:hypothetical protein